MGRAAAGRLSLVHCFGVSLHLLLLVSARKESAKEKQLKEEEKILESVAEGRGIVVARAGGSGLSLLLQPHACFTSGGLASGKQDPALSNICLLSLNVSEGDG